MTKLKKYSFLFKPVFYIFNIIFATWLVLKIEKLHPSSLGSYSSIFEDYKPDNKTQNEREFSNDDKAFLKKLFSEYKADRLDSNLLNKQIDLFLQNKKGPPK